MTLVRVLAAWLWFSACISAQQYAFHTYRQPNGLRNLAINGLAADRFGFLWVATENGAYRFLGSGFERFGPEQGIAEIDVLDVVSDPGGTIWAGTRKNLYRWDGQRFLSAGREAIPFSGPRNIAVEDSRHLLVASKGSLYRLEHDAEGNMRSFAPVFSESMVSALPALNQVKTVSVVRARTGRQTVWLGCGKKLLSLPDDHIGSRIAPGDGAITAWGKNKGLAEDSWDGVLLDHAGALWAAGQNRVMVLPKGATRFVDRSIPGSDPENVFAHAPLIEDQNGRVIAPDDAGLVRWNGTTWQHIGLANGLPSSDHIAGMVFDAAGDLWLGSHGAGLFNWPGYEDWEGWSDAQRLPSSSVWSIIPSRANRAFVGTEHGPASIDMRSGSIAPLSAMHRWAYGQVYAMGTGAGGSLWAGTYSGSLLSIDPNNGRTKETAKLPAPILNALSLADGHVFFFTSKGLWERKGGNAPQRVAAADTLLGNSTRIDAGCAAPDGAVWFLAKNRLLREKDGQWTLPPIDGLPQLRGSWFSISCAANGAVWVTGQQTGTWRLTLAHGRVNASSLALPAEFQALAPLAILVDRRGWVWLGTDLGLLVWNGSSWRHLTQESGLIWDDVNQGMIVSASDGSLWVGTSGGLSHLMHPEHVFDPIPLSVSVSTMQRGSQSYQATQPITLPWSPAPLQFQISSPTMRNRSELILKARMVGLQPDWETSQNGFQTYSRLDPGSYTFMAIACNPGLNTCSAPVKVDVTILPPWWRTFWFYGLCLLAFLLLLVAGSRFYASHLLGRARHLEKLISERTHQLKKRTQELEASRELLRAQATHDGLTGMLNRTAALGVLAAEMDRVLREGKSLAVALIDLDYFKRINDSYGHLAGDEALRRFATAIATAIRPYDHAGRYGGEEFLLILTKVPRKAAEQRLASLHDAISNLRICTQGSEFTMNCSMGATVFDPSDVPPTVESLLAVADEALYAAKAAGRNCVIFRQPSRLSCHVDASRNS